MIRFVSFVAIAVVLISCLFSYEAKAQCFSQQTSCGSPAFIDDINIPCAVQAAAAVADCRANGGRFLGCAVQGFGAYLSCNGGLARARRAQLIRLRAAYSGQFGFSRCR